MADASGRKAKRTKASPFACGCPAPGRVDASGLPLCRSLTPIRSVDFKPEFVEQIAGRRAALRAELASLFPRPRAVIWEIGCGHGHFLVRYAADSPEKFCVGVDLSLERIDKGRRKADRAKLVNCHFVRAEARE